MEGNGSNIFDLLIQLPLVGVFIWYSLEMNKRIQTITDTFTDALEKHDGSVDTRIEKLINSQNQCAVNIANEIRTVLNEFKAHDDFVKQNVSQRRRPNSK